MPETPPISLWDHSAPTPPPGDEFARDTTCDLAIVGGGYTGLSTALHGAKLGLDCRVLEAQSIGFGGSGRNVGLVNAGLWLPPQDVQDLLGAARGSDLIARLGAMPAYVFDLIDTYEIQCEVTRSGTLHAAHSPKGFADLTRRAQGWQALGAPVDLLDRAAAAEKIGSDRFFGALWDHRAGTINPMGYARGLARAARSLGALIHTGVRISGLTRDNGLWHLHSTAGLQRARHVVLATNAYSDDLWPGLRQSYTSLDFFQLATEPLGARAEHILPQRQGLWDTGRIMFSLRRDAQGRLIIGSMGATHGGTCGLSRRWAQRQLARLFPDLGKVSFEHAWHGQIAMTPDHLFRIHELAEGLYSPVGYNGRGITTGTMFGKALAERIAGVAGSDLPVGFSPLQADRGSAVKSRLYGLACSANQILKCL